LKNYGIDLVVFLNDPICEKRNIHSNYLYHRLRLDSIDTILGDEEHIVNEIRDYVQKYNKGVRISISTPLKNE